MNFFQCVLQEFSQKKLRKNKISPLFWVSENQTWNLNINMQYLYHQTRDILKNKLKHALINLKKHSLLYLITLPIFNASPFRFALLGTSLPYVTSFLYGFPWTPLQINNATNICFRYKSHETIIQKTKIIMCIQMHNFLLVLHSIYIIISIEFL